MPDKENIFVVLHLRDNLESHEKTNVHFNFYSQHQKENKIEYNAKAICHVS
jgi:hypothetical protein